MLNALKRNFKRNMQSSGNHEEVLQTPNIRTNSNPSLVSFPQRLDDIAQRTLTCPTCGGSGRLTQEHENDLVALIPVRDKRLKSRAKVYVIIAVLIIVLVAGVLSTVFLFPRDVHIELINSTAFNITLAPVNGSLATMYLNNTIQVNNSNFFDATFENVYQQVTWDRSTIVADTLFPGKQLVVPAKSSVTHHFFVKLVYTTQRTCVKMKRACCWFNMMFIVITQGKMNGLTMSQDVSSKSYEYVDCLFDSPDWLKKCGII